jgi:transketolase
MDTMRDRFSAVATELLDGDDRVAIVLADIGVSQFVESGAVARHPERVINVGIREQLMIGVAAGLALEGMSPIVHSYAPFLIERPFEQIKLDLGHQDVGAVLVSIGASYDAAGEGRTHQAPEDVAVLATLPGWHIDVPGHPDEVEMLLRHAVACAGRHYLRLSGESNAEPVATRSGVIEVVRRVARPAAVAVGIGPALGPLVAATANLPVTVLYAATVRPFDRQTLRAAAGLATDVVLVEPYLAGTSTAEVTAALADRPHRVLALGVTDPEIRRYGTPEEHRRAHGLDADGVRNSIVQFIGG